MNLTTLARWYSRSPTGHELDEILLNTERQRFRSGLALRTSKSSLEADKCQDNGLTDKGNKWQTGGRSARAFPRPMNPPIAFQGSEKVT